MTNCYAAGDVIGEYDVGGLAGRHSYRTITNCSASGDVSGTGWSVGGLVGQSSRGTISNSYAIGSVSGENVVGGLVGSGENITNCYSTGRVSGDENIGGLVGVGNNIANCYSTGSVFGYEVVGGFAGYNSGTITNCYSTGGVSGYYDVGGLVGENGYYGIVLASFWDVNTSGQTTSDGGTGLPTNEMQKQITFTDAGWDFVNVWWILEGVGYPRHSWEIPVLHAEPEVTLGTSNRISWEPVVGGIEYYAECSTESNFVNIYNSGWIKETSFEFTGLELGQRYWYCVKARNTASKESSWSNVESSLQGTLADAVEIMIAAESMKSKNLKKTLLNKIETVLEMIDEGLYENALSKLEHDILEKTDGCGDAGEPDKNDWIITCEQQNVVYPLVVETIEYVKSLME
jgi:hypothetical protein